MSNQSGWHQKTIADLFSSSCPGEWGNEGNHGSGTPVLRSTNFRNNGYIDYSDIAYRAIPSSRLDSRRIDIGTILIEKAGGSSTRPAGRVVYCDRTFGGTASNFVEVVQVDTALSAKFVFYLLYHNFHSGLVHKYQQQTTGIINFKLREYSQEVITVPESRDEQSKIAEVLSTVDRAIAQTEALIAKQQRIKTGLMQDLLTRGIDEHGNLRSEATHTFKDSPLGRIPVEWDVTTLAELSKGGARNGYFKKPELVGSGFKLINVADLYQPFGLDTDVKNVDRISASESDYDKYNAIPGDIFFTRSSLVLSGIAHCNIIRKVKEPTLFECHVMRIRPNVEKVFPEYLAMYCRSHSARLHLMAGAKQVTMTTISQAELENLRVAVPKSLTEQANIAEAVLAVGMAERKAAKERDKLRLLKTGLMQDLLTGKVRVTPLLDRQQGVIDA